MRTLFVTLVIATVFVAGCLASPASHASASSAGRTSASPKFFVLHGLQVGGFAAVDRQGNIYSDSGTTSIVKLSPAGKVLAQWDGLGVVPDRPDTAGGIALDGHGHVYAVDTDANRIVQLTTSHLELAAQWGGFGGAPGQFDSPEGIALDAGGNLFVADMGNGRIQKLSSAGQVLAVWDSSADFRDPRAVAVGRHGDIFVADTGNDSVMELSPSGKRLATWDHRGFSNGSGAGLAADKAGHIYVSGGSRSGTYRLSHNSNQFSFWSSEPFGLYYPSGLANSPQGTIYVSECPSDISLCRIVKLSTKGLVTKAWYSGVPQVTTGTMVDVGGYKLHLRCIGQGGPTVVFENGIGDSNWVWSYPQAQLASHTRVCSYDRAGNGLSDSRPYPLQASGLQIAHELHALLQAAGVPPPYVLAGHSFGGLFVRIFAGTYPSEVVGLVLVDSVNENAWPDTFASGEGELPDLTSTEQQIHDLTGRVIKGSLGNLPLVVLSQTADLPSCWDCFPPRTKWDAYQAELATASSDVVHVRATRSGHYIALDQPGLVVQAVTQVVDAVRAPTHSLPSCTTYEQLGGACVS